MLANPALWAVLSAAAWAVGAFWQMWLELDVQYRTLRTLLDPLESLQQEEIERRLARGNRLVPWGRARVVRQVVRELDELLSPEEQREISLSYHRAGAWTVVMAGAVFAGVAGVIQLVAG